MNDFFNGISQLEAVKSAIESFADSLRFLGLLSFILTLILIIIIAAIVLAPTLIALKRMVRLRKFVAIVNVIAIFCFLVNFILPLIIWALLFILALTGKKEIKTSFDIPSIIINTSSSQVNNKNFDRR